MQNHILYNIRHISELSNANGRLYDHHILRLHWKVYTHISRQYIYILEFAQGTHRAYNTCPTPTQRSTFLPIQV